MSEEKKEDDSKQLVEEFRAFRVEWKKFLTNSFRPLVVAVDALTTDVDTLVKQNNKQHEGIQQGMVTMEKNILKMLKAIKEKK